MANTTTFNAYCKGFVQQALYWFQKEAKAAVRNAWEVDKKRSVLVSAPTGAGKTIIFSSLIRDVAENKPDRVLILVHRDALIKQTIDKLQFVWPGCNIGTVKGKIREYDKQIIVASVQTLSGRIQDFIDACEKHGPIGYVIIDEAHHSYAAGWRTIVDAFKAQGHAFFLGVSATPIRTNKKESLVEIFDDVVYSISIFRLIQEGFLSPLSGYTVPTSLSLSGVRMTKGDFNVKDLTARINSSDYDKKIVNTWKEKARDRKSICFAVNINHIENLVQEFNAAGAKAVGIHGELPVDEQRQILRDFNAGKYNVLINCMLLTEGFDEPSIDCVLMARPTSSMTFYIQMIGRGLRLHPGKKDCLLIDFTSNSQTNTMVTMQDLLGFYGMSRAQAIYKKNSALDLEAGSISTIEISPKSIPGLQAVEKFGEEMESSLAYNEIDVFNMNDFAWVEMDGNFFVTARKNLAISVYKSGTEYIPYLIFTGSNDRCIAKISDPVEKEFAIAIANVYLFDYGNRRLVAQGQAWRNKEPTPVQRETLMKAIKAHKTWDNGAAIDFNQIQRTKGAYSDMLTAIYSTAYIKSTNIQVISRDVAIEKLKRMVIAEMETANQDQDAAGSHRKNLKNIDLELNGNYTPADYAAFIDMIVSLQADKYGEYPVKFLLESPIVFENGTVKILSQKKLSDNQRAFLNDKIPPRFRLYFREKKLVITEPEGTK